MQSAIPPVPDQLRTSQYTAPPSVRFQDKSKEVKIVQGRVIVIKPGLQSKCFPVMRIPRSRLPSRAASGPMVLRFKHSITHSAHGCVASPEEINSQGRVWQLDDPTLSGLNITKDRIQSPWAVLVSWF